MRGIPPPGAGGYMRPRMAVPERQLSLHERLKEIEMLIFQARSAYLRARRDRAKSAFPRGGFSFFRAAV